MKKVMKDITKKKNQGPGRPRENEKYNQQIKGVVSEPVRQLGEDDQDLSSVLVDCVMQFPLYFKCISNTVRQIDKNSNIDFCFTGDKIYVWESEQQSSRCCVSINCNQLTSYYFNYPQQGFIKFDVPIQHISNTFNFYNRSSIKLDLRIYGPQNPILKIDSYKTEKRNIQCITNNIIMAIEPCNEQLQMLEQMIETNSQQLSQSQLESLQQLDRVQKMKQIFSNKKLFNDCYFLNYKNNKVYSFSLLNSDVKKFVTEVQKDCQKIQIRREIIKENGQTKMKNIVIECRLPGSGSMKSLDGKKNAMSNYRFDDTQKSPLQILIEQSNYKQYKDVDIERTYEIGSNILKQISSNNPQPTSQQSINKAQPSMLRFIMLDHQKVVIKIKDSVATFKFEINGV